MALEVKLSSADVTAGDEGIIALMVFEGPLEKQKHVLSVNEALGGAVFNHVANVDFKAQTNQMADVQTLGRLTARRVLLVGLGPKKGFDDARLRHAVGAATRAAGGVPKLAMVLPERVKAPQLRAVAEGLALGAYRFHKYMTGERLPKSQLQSVTVFREAKATAADQKAISAGLEVAAAVPEQRERGRIVRARHARVAIVQLEANAHDRVVRRFDDLEHPSLAGPRQLLVLHLPLSQLLVALDAGRSLRRVPR